MTVLLALALAQVPQDRVQLPDGPLIREMRLNSVDQSGQFTLIRADSAKLDPPKLSPLNGWMFEHVTVGYARDSLESSFNLRMRVFNQYRPDQHDPTDFAARMLMRLWEFNRWRLNLDHSNAVHLRSVDVYLCAGGEPGAEQVMTEDPYQNDVAGHPARVNNIYIYSVPTLIDRVEFARELAHEYGHATWPPMGGYTEPEQWVSGDMGERVFMMWLLDAMKNKKITSNDVMEVPQASLQRYYEVRVLPDLQRVATKGPDRNALSGNDKRAYAEALGMVTYAAAVVPSKVFGRALLFTKDRSAKNFENALLEAFVEAGTVEFRVPSELSGQALWIPKPSGTPKGFKVLRQESSWIKVQPLGPKMSALYLP